MRARWFVAGWIVALVVACAPAPTLMAYHRQTLDELAAGTMECRVGDMQFEDSTPENMPQMANDPETRRYTVRGCEREAAFVCYTFRYMGDNSGRPECQALRQRGEGSLGGVYVGPVRVGGD